MWRSAKLKNFFHKFVSFFLIFQLSFFQLISLIVPQLVYAQAETELTASYDATAHELDLTLSQNSESEYRVYYQADQLEAVTGIFSTTESVFLGICSDEGDCVEDAVSKLVVKASVDNEIQVQRLELIDDVLNIVDSYESSSLELDDDEQFWLENKTAQGWQENKDGSYTIDKVELDQTYTAPQNDQVSVTFTQLPADPGNLTIKEVILSEEQVTELDALSNIAFDITSDMEDGSFEYDLMLPIPEGNDENIQVIFVESVEELSDVKEVETVIEDKQAKVENLDHFTIFVVTTPVQTGLSGECTVEVVGATTSLEDRCFNSIQAAINDASEGDTINIAAGTYYESYSSDLALKIDKSITIIGTGMPIIDGGGRGKVAQVSADDVVIRGLKFNNNNIGIGLFLTITTAPSTANNITVENCEFSNNNIGLFLAGANGATIENNNFPDNNYRSIVIQEDSDNNVIKSNTITMTGLDVNAGIVIGSDSGNNIIGGNNSADGNNITIPTNTTIAAHMPYVIHFSGGSNSNAVKNNTINNGARAIQIDEGNTGTYTISDNTITNDGTNSINMNFGIGVNSGNVIVTDNTMIGTGRPLEFRSGTGTVTFTGNTISGNNFFGVNLGSYTDNPVVTGNSFLEFGGNGQIVWNQGAGAVDATSNWWGDTDPSDNINNSGSGSIDYSPWWGADYVGDSHSTGWNWYTNDSIQDAIDLTSDGDIVNVTAGIYTKNLTVNKPVSLLGVDRDTTIIDGGGSGSVVNVISNNTTISGFTIQNSGSDLAADIGVKIDSVSNVTVKNNIIKNNSNGVGILTASNNFINSNEINTNDYYGVVIVAGTGNTLDSNTITANGLDAIALDNASAAGGLVTMGSTGNFIKGNTINSNRDGIFFGENCDNNQVIDGNQISNVTNRGISFWRSNGHTVTGNSINATNTGIHLLGSSNNTIVENNLTGNIKGIQVVASWQVDTWYQCLNNDISGNSISGNTTRGIEIGLDAGGGQHQTTAVIGTNNWWGDQSGPDSVGTGIGDYVSSNVTFSPWCLTSDCSTKSDIYSSDDSAGAALSAIPQDVVAGDLTIKGVTGTGNIFVAKYNSVSDVPNGGTTFGAGNFYYNIDAPDGTIFPIDIEISYSDTVGALDYLDEAHFFSLYYQKAGVWYDYKLDTLGTTGYDPSSISIDSGNDAITATLNHLTPIVPVVDTTLPTVSNGHMYVSYDGGSTYAEEAYVSAGDFVRVEVDAKDDVAVDHVIFRIKDAFGGGYIATDSVYAPVSGDTYRYEFQIPVDGKYINTHLPITETLLGQVFWARSVDTVGNSTNANVAEYFTFDKTIPTITTPVMSVSTDGGTIYNIKNIVKPGDMVRIETDATDTLSGVDYVEFRIKNGTTGGYITALAKKHTANSGDTYRYDFTMPADGKYVNNHNPVTLGLNEQSAWVRSYDVVGNYIHGKSISFTFDNIDPSVPINGTPDNTFINTNNFDFNWDASIDTNSPLIYLFVSTKNPVEVGGVLTTGLWQSGVLTSNMIHSSGASDGTWYWQVKAVDPAGNKSVWSEIWDVTIDTTAPVITINNPDSSSAQSKTVKASTNEGTLKMRVNASGVATCDGSLSSFSAYASATFSTEADNGKTICYQAIDAANNTTYKLSDAISGIDVTAPIVKIDALSTTDTSPELTGTIDDSIATIEVNVNSNSYSATNNGDGTWTLANDTINALGDGIYDVLVTATDLAGNAGTDATTNELTIDTVAPNGTFTYYEDGILTTDITYIKNINQLTFDSVFTDPSPSAGLDIETFTIYEAQADGSFGWGANGAKAYCSFRRDASYQNAYDISGGSLTGIPFTDCSSSVFDGEYYIMHNVHDKSYMFDRGINQFKDVLGLHFVIDTVDPTSAITLPTNDGDSSTVYNNAWDGSIAGTATDNGSVVSGIARVDLSIKRDSDGYYWDGGAWVVGTEATRFLVTGTTNWSYSLTSPAQDIYTITSHAVDNAGNVESSYSITVVFDKIIPQVDLTMNPVDPDGDNGWYKTNPEITLTATDDNDPNNHGFKQLEYQWNSQTGTWTTTTNATVSFNPPGEGHNILYYRALDKAGNYSATGIKNVRYDNTSLEEGPQNISVSPNPTSGTTATVSWDAASDDITIDKYEIIWQLDGTSTQHSKSVNSTTFETEIDQLTEGKWNIKVKAYDGVGNSKEGSVTLMVDRTAPDSPVLTLDSTGVGTANLSWSIVDDAEEYLIFYGVASGDYIYGANVGNVTSYTVQGLGAGNYFFVVRAKDTADNQSDNSNEVNTGVIAGAPGVAPGGPAEGFIPAGEVQGVATEETEPMSEVNLDGEVKGTSNTTSWLKYNLPWILLILQAAFILLADNLMRHKRGLLKHLITLLVTILAIIIFNKLIDPDVYSPGSVMVLLTNGFTWISVGLALLSKAFSYAFVEEITS